MPKPPRSLDIPIGRVEFMGQVLHIVEHGGRLVAACNDEHGLPYEALSAPRLDSRACRALMCDAVGLLLDAANLSIALAAYTSDKGQDTAQRAMGTQDHAKAKRSRCACPESLAPNC